LAGRGLRRGQRGAAGVVFFVVAAAAPLVGMTGALPVAILLGNGAAAPGAYVAVGLVLLLFSVGYGAMSRHVSNAGTFFAYVGRGLGAGPGVGAPFVSLPAYLAVQLAVYGFFGAVASQQLGELLGVQPPWWGGRWRPRPSCWCCRCCASTSAPRSWACSWSWSSRRCWRWRPRSCCRAGGPQGLQPAASFSPAQVFAGGFAGSAGIALSFAFASFIGFEATAIYAEETRDPARSECAAGHLAAVAVITMVFAVTSWAVVSGLGAVQAPDRVAELTAVGGVPLSDLAAVLYAVAEQFVGAWLATAMSWLVLSSLFAGLLAFQNASARYVFSMSRAGVLPCAGARVNRLGAPAPASALVTGVTAAVVAVFAARSLDPVVDLFLWCSGLAVIAIVLVEVLVAVAVPAFFRSRPDRPCPLSSVVAPVLAAAGLLAGLYLLTSRFGLLTGTVATGVDPAAQAWGLSSTGWLLVLLPFAVVVCGTAVGLSRRRTGTRAALAACSPDPPPVC
jgi:amino acid transporter